MEGIEIVIVHMKIEVVVSSYLETATHISSKIEHHKSRSHTISCFGILIFLIASLWFCLFLGVDVCHCLSSTPSPGADPENFSRGGPTLTYNCGSAQIWKITVFFISSNMGDIKLCKFQGGSGPPRPPL